MKHHVKQLHYHASNVPHHHKRKLFWLTLVLGFCLYLFLTSASLLLLGPHNIVNYLDNTKYVVDGKRIMLVAGRAETDYPVRTIIKYFGNGTVADLDGDGLKDVAFLLTQTTENGEEFYYLASALYTGSGYNGTNAIYLGDHIAPQTTETLDRVIIVNYAMRNIGEPLIIPPTVQVSKYFIVRDGTLTEVTK